MRDRIRAARAHVRERWESRAPHERMAAATLAVLLGAALCVWLIQSVDRARTQLRGNVSMLQAQAAGLERDATEFERLRATPVAPPSQTDLRALVQAEAATAGLTRALGSIEVADATHVRVVFGAVAFADWLRWVAGLESQRVHLDACRIEALSTPGLVSVTATVSRPAR